MLKPTTLLCLFLISTLCSKAQQVNLIQNPSFEEYNYCPAADMLRLENILPGGWFSSLPSSDYFNPCATIETRKSPQNRFGNQYPYSGDAYIGISTGFVPYSPPPIPQLLL